MKAVEFAAAAIADLKQATSFYGDKSLNLGDALLREVEGLTFILEKSPEIGSPVDGGFRKLVVRKFPYMLIYVVETERVLILCVAHQRMNPEIWRRRVAKYAE